MDLSAATVGSSGFVNFKITGATADPSRYTVPAWIFIFNESGCGLDIDFQTSGESEFIPAGGWKPLNIMPGEAGYTWTVAYVLPNAGVNSLVTIYYPPGDLVHATALGNSPVNASLTTAITTELVDSIATPTMETTMGLVNAHPSLIMRSISTPSTPVLLAHVQATSGNILLFFDGSTNFIGAINTLGITDSSAAGIKLTGGPLTLHLIGTLSGLQVVTGSGAGTFNHSLGVTPTIVLLELTAGTPVAHSVGSYTSTQFTVTGPAVGQAWKALVLV